MADRATEIGSGHILLALLEEPGAIAWRGVRLGGLRFAQVYDGVVARRKTPPPAPGPRALQTLIYALNMPLAAWLGYTELAAQGEGEPADDGYIAAARAAVADLAALGGSRGLLRPAEVFALTGRDPDVAGAALRAAAGRIARP
jgi:hypothetical protein